MYIIISNYIFNYIKFLYLLSKDLNLFLLSILFLITMIFNFNIFFYYQTYFFLFFIFFNIFNLQYNKKNYKSLFYKSNNFYIVNKKYLIYNNLFYLIYLIIECYYINFFQFYMIGISLFVFIVDSIKIYFYKNNNQENDIENNNQIY